MRMPEHQYLNLIRNEWVALGIKDSAAGAWTEIKNDDHATFYEIGRLLESEDAAGRIKRVKGFGMFYVEIDDFVVYPGNDYHARIGNYMNQYREERDETY